VNKRWSERIVLQAHGTGTDNFAVEPIPLAKVGEIKNSSNRAPGPLVEAGNDV
jgi:hypothetical protein